ncbi:ATP-dependent DNA helicase [Trichonephila inaurata madagascariensis]|uniref:ATP-dependent DNA helicase n=1 Tax=Trichonephila inaurata madagascariensis TaxID=2747483 RepID=A0A8X7CRW6_9ARAC|nr:ATP-dependent DNA helicase [Trichonephila inaurata madagascariensis]
MLYGNVQSSFVVRQAVDYISNWDRFKCPPRKHYFTEGNAAERAQFALETLTAFFRLCNEDEFARTLFLSLNSEYPKTIEGRICSNYKACQVRGLLENDEHWNKTLQEAAFVHSPRMLRDPFAVMLQVCAISNPN